MNRMSLKYSKKELKSSNKNRSLNYLSKIKSNFSSLKEYPVKIDFKSNIPYTFIPAGKHFYQGVSFNFEDTTQKTINDFYDFYNKRHTNAYFISSYKIASQYGLNKDFSNIVYITIPDAEEIKNPINKYNEIYPLYYIPGIRGTNIKYELNTDVKLLNIGDIKTMKILFNLVKNDNDLSEEKKEDILNLFYNTCILYEHDKAFKYSPIKCKRTSTEYDDDELVKLFQDYIIPKLQALFNLNIDGWIHYKTNLFHDEILLISNKYLNLTNITRLPSVKYDNIPTIKEFKESMKYKMVTNNNIPNYTILSNFIIVRPK